MLPPFGTRDSRSFFPFRVGDFKASDIHLKDAAIFP